MAKDDDFLMRRRLHRVIDLYNNSARNNNATKPIYFLRDEKKFTPPTSLRGRHAAAAGSGCAMFRRMRFNSSNISLKRRTAVGATDFLRRDDKLAALLPAIERMATLQKDCAAALPSMFQ